MPIFRDWHFITTYLRCFPNGLILKKDLYKISPPKNDRSVGYSGPRFMRELVYLEPLAF